MTQPIGDSKIKFVVIKSRSSAPHGAQFRVGFDCLTAHEAGEFMILMTRLADARNALFHGMPAPTPNHVGKFLECVDDGFTSKGDA